MHTNAPPPVHGKNRMSLKRKAPVLPLSEREPFSAGSGDSGPSCFLDTQNPGQLRNVRNQGDVSAP